MSVTHGVKCDDCGAIIGFSGTCNSGYVIYKAKDEGWIGGHRIHDFHRCPECQKRFGTKIQKPESK